MVQIIVWFAFGMLLFGWLMALTLTALDARAIARRDRAEAFGALNDLREKQRASAPRAAPPLVEIVTVPRAGGEHVKAPSPTSKPRGVNVTRDDDPVHTRETMFGPVSETIPAPPPECAEAGESSDEATLTMNRPPISLLKARAGLRFPPRPGQMSG